MKILRILYFVLVSVCGIVVVAVSCLSIWLFIFNSIAPAPQKCPSVSGGEVLAKSEHYDNMVVCWYVDERALYGKSLKRHEYKKGGV